MANALKFMREVKYEGQKVTWIGRQMTVRFTIFVLAVTFVMSTIMFLADWAISSGIEFVLGR